MISFWVLSRKGDVVDSCPWNGMDDRGEKISSGIYLYSNDGKKIYLSNPVYKDGGSIAVMDGESLVIEKIIDVPTISPLAIATKP